MIARIVKMKACNMASKIWKNASASGIITGTTTEIYPRGLFRAQKREEADRKS